MLTNAFTKSALVASLLLGTSALAQAQTHQESTAPTAGGTESSAPAAPTGTPGTPPKAERNRTGSTKSSETTPNQPGTTKSSETGANQPGTPTSSQATPNQTGRTQSSEVGQNGTGATKSSESAAPGKSTAESAPSRSGNSVEPGQAPATAGADRNNAAPSSSASTATKSNLSTSQKTEIRNTIISDNSAPRANNVEISLSVGVAVPPTVRFAPLPPRIVSIEPAWRGYEYFVYRDEIVIIEPGTRRIVAILVS